MSFQQLIFSVVTMFLKHFTWCSIEDHRKLLYGGELYSDVNKKNQLTQPNPQGIHTKKRGKITGQVCTVRLSEHLHSTVRGFSQYVIEREESAQLEIFHFLPPKYKDGSQQLYEFQLWLSTNFAKKIISIWIIIVALFVFRFKEQGLLDKRVEKMEN